MSLWLELEQITPAKCLISLQNEVFLISLQSDVFLIYLQNDLFLTPL